MNVVAQSIPFSKEVETKFQKGEIQCVALKSGIAVRIFDGEIWATLRNIDKPKIQLEDKIILLHEAEIHNLSEEKICGCITEYLKTNKAEFGFLWISGRRVAIWTNKPERNHIKVEIQRS